MKVHHEHDSSRSAPNARWRCDPRSCTSGRSIRVDDAVNRVHGVVAEIGYLGASCIFRIRTDGGRMIQVMQPNQARDLSLAYQWDEPVWVSWAPESGVLIVG